MTVGQDIQLINERVGRESAFVDRLLVEVGKVIVGQQDMIERLLIGLLCNGHVLLEGVPGLAKTLAVNSLAQAIQASFKRIQFTPDLLPADLIGTMVYHRETGEFVAQKGPIFAQLVLADEVNRAPSKVQSAMLEAMQERQVTIGNETFAMPDPFLVLATQNPIEQEGTYPLPEAQVDRFMLKVRVTYPNKREERAIVDRMSRDTTPQIETVITTDDLIRARSVADEIYVDDKIKDYIVDLVLATRDPEAYGLGDLRALIEFGGSPRASIALTRAAKAHAFLRHRGYVTPEDVKAIGMDVLRHRVLVTYEAEAEEINSEEIARQIFDHIEVP
ncbi:MAG: MoxR family ATPase [Candidatus Latescibacteria bacterium]|nr:MoxR family ATPase [Candidatus Latescibacterota bacterium]